jgi:hypothetical protein
MAYYPGAVDDGRVGRNPAAIYQIPEELEIEPSKQLPRANTPERIRQRQIDSVRPRSPSSTSGR